MEKEYTQVHTLTIKNIGEKKFFQIKLAKNAKRIIGIQVTVTPIPTETLIIRTPIRTAI